MNEEYIYPRIRERITNQKQMSEAFVLNAVLAFSGGLQDAYTYVVRNHVFANAQTGNVVLMSANFMEGNWIEGLRYFLPIASFAAGVFLAERVQHRYKKKKAVHWRQIILIVEIVILFLVGLMPQSINSIANAVVSFTCAMQVQSFQRVAGNSYASTMCIGNLRSGTAALSGFLRDGNKRDREKVKYYFGVIGVFALGAAIGSMLSPFFGQYVIWVSCIILVLACMIMELDRKREVL